MAAPAQATALVALALKTRDPFAAAAVYDVATVEQRGPLEQVISGERKNALMFARWEHTPGGVLQALAGVRDCAVRVRLDKNPSTPARTLLNLYSGEKQAALIGLLAQHSHAPASMLEEIAEFATDMKSLTAVCGNSAASGQALRMLAGRMPGQFDSDMATNPSTPPDVLVQVYRRSNAFIRAAVIAHPSCPQCVIDQAVNEHEVAVLRHLSQDRRVDVQVLTGLSRHADAAVRRGVAANPASPGALIKPLANDNASSVRRAVAARDDLTPASMQCLARDQDHWVRQWLGRNPLLPKALLQQLAQDSESEVRRAVARNPGCPPALLKKLAGDGEAWVRAAVAYQTNATSALLKRLAEDTGVDVLSGVASHPRTAQSILQHLARSPEADVRRGVILNRCAKRSILRPLLQDPYYLHRLLLIGNPVLNDEDRWALHEDPDQSVRFAVFKWFSDRFARQTNNKMQFSME